MLYLRRTNYKNEWMSTRLIFVLKCTWILFCVYFKCFTIKFDTSLFSSIGLKEKIPSSFSFSVSGEDKNPFFLSDFSWTYRTRRLYHPECQKPRHYYINQWSSAANIAKSRFWRPWFSKGRIAYSAFSRKISGKLISLYDQHLLLQGGGLLSSKAGFNGGWENTSR